MELCKWSFGYNIYRDDEKIASVNDTTFKDSNLDYNKTTTIKLQLLML